MVAALSELAGVGRSENVEVLLDRDAFTVNYDPGKSDLEDMYDAITKLGFSPGIDENRSANRRIETDSESIPEPIATALALPENRGKALFIDFFAEWCIACQALDQQTLDTNEVQQALENYVVIKVDTDAYPDSAVFYNVVAMPTLLILNPAGEEEFRSVGPISAFDLAQSLEQFDAH